MNLAKACPEAEPKDLTFARLNFEQLGDDFQHRASYLAENCHLLIIGSLHLGGICKTAMDAFPRFSGPNRTFLCSRIADCNNEVKILCMQLIDLLGLASMCNANFFQRLYRFWMHIARGLRPG